MTLSGKLISKKNRLRFTEVGFSSPRIIPKTTNSTIDKIDIIFKLATFVFNGLTQIIE